MDVAFDDAAAEVAGGGGVAGLPFVVFAHVYELGGRGGFESPAGLFDVEFADARLGVFDESEESFGVLHGSRFDLVRASEFERASGRRGPRVSAFLT